jgi:glycerol-3-phosphate dehydrogenase (NAD(P)+)
MAGSHRVAVLGGGSFGTVIANIIAANGHAVSLWMRNGERAELINESRENPTYLPGYVLHPQLQATTDLEASISGADIVFVAVPSKSCREVARQMATCIDPGAMVISTTKGIEADGFRLMSQVLAEELPSNPLGVLSGPNLAKEIAAGQLTGTVVASEHAALKEEIQALLHSGSLRVYSSDDMYGVELGGALKNVYAIIAGIGAALEVGENTVGMLLTRSLAEMSRFAVSLGADPLTFIGLAGVGDLVVTCSSPLSRNYRVGYALGKGQALDDILDELGQVAEGINTLRILKTEAEVIGTLMSAEQPQDVEFSLKEEGK